MERDFQSYIQLSFLNHFNSHAHVERDCTGFAFRACFKNFNSHAHVERDNWQMFIRIKLFNFNSHAHVERDEVAENSYIHMEISTHTLTWSVTYQWGVWITAWAFQLTRSRGAWLVSLIKLSDLSNFNSHAHVERDYAVKWVILPICYFNSHAHVERDCTGFAFRACFKNFNSHAHVERDYIGWNVLIFCKHFNSHAHVERDIYSWILDNLIVKFQLTRSRGAWR